MACRCPFCKRRGEGMKAGWKLEARQGSGLELVVVWGETVAVEMLRM